MQLAKPRARTRTVSARVRSSGKLHWARLPAHMPPQQLAKRLGLLVSHRRAQRNATCDCTLGGAANLCVTWEAQQLRMPPDLAVEMLFAHSLATPLKHGNTLSGH